MRQGWRHQINADLTLCRVHMCTGQVLELGMGVVLCRCGKPPLHARPARTHRRRLQNRQVIRMDNSLSEGPLKMTVNSLTQSFTRSTFQSLIMSFMRSISRRLPGKPCETFGSYWSLLDYARITDSAIEPEGQQWPGPTSSQATLPHPERPYGAQALQGLAQPTEQPALRHSLLSGLSWLAAVLLTTVSHSQPQKSNTHRSQPSGLQEIQEEFCSVCRSQNCSSGRRWPRCASSSARAHMIRQHG